MNAQTLGGFIGTLVVILIVCPVLLAKRKGEFNTSYTYFDDYVERITYFLEDTFRINIASTRTGLFFSALLSVAVPISAIGILLGSLFSISPSGIILGAVILGFAAGYKFTQPRDMFK